MLVHMPGVVKQNGRTYSLNRVGELVMDVNEPTFQLLKRIFGKDGPYRRVLRKFGFGIMDNPESFLKIIGGRVYSDIDKETKIIWRNVSYKLVESKGEVTFKFSWQGLPSLFRYFRKFLTDVYILAHPDKYVYKAISRYGSFSKDQKRLLEKGSITLTEFLELYETVVFVTYLYELFFHFNNSIGILDTVPGLKDYIDENDYLLKLDSSYVEGVYKPSEGFFVQEDVSPKEISLENLIFIPEVIPPFDGEGSKTKVAEIQLQCLKNNLRAKTNTLLYLLSLSKD
jgi:hypothetical protein